MTRDLAHDIADLIRAEQTFHEKTVAEACDAHTRDAEFRIALHRAIDMLRDEGIEFAPTPGEVGLRRRVDGATALQRARRFHQGAVRKLERAGTQFQNIDPAKLSSADQKALTRAQDHLSTLAVNAHIGAQRGQETSNLLSKMGEQRKKSA